MRTTNMSFSNFKRNIEVGDTIILYVNPYQIYAIEVKPKIAIKNGDMVEYIFQTQYGALQVIKLVGLQFGAKVPLSKGYAYALYPTPELWTQTLRHRTQILYTPDISLIITELDIGPGSKVCEAGTGSGSLSHAFLRVIGENGLLYSCDFHEERVHAAQKEIDQHGLASRMVLRQKDVCVEGWGVNQEADAVFLDIPMPWEAIPHAIKSIKTTGGRICSFSPCVEQVSRTCETMKKFGLVDLNTVECLQREFQMKNINVLPIEIKKLPIHLMRNMNKKCTDADNSAKKLKTSHETNDLIECNSSREKIATPKSSDSMVNVAQSEKVSESTEKLQFENVRKSTEKLSESEKCCISAENISVSEKNSILTTEIAESDKDSHSLGKMLNKDINIVDSKQNVETVNGQDSIYKFKSAVSVLKMPGHTGFLTFATVPPSLSSTVDN